MSLLARSGALGSFMGVPSYAQQALTSLGSLISQHVEAVGPHTPSPWSRCAPHGPSSRSIATSSTAASSSEQHSSKGGKATRSKQTEAEAREAMQDPMSQLLASRGMPLGFSLHNKQRQRGEDPSPSAPPRPEPGYRMEALDEIFGVARASAAVQQQRQSLQRQAQAQAQGQEQEQAQAGSVDDSWATTRHSPMEIARRIIETNEAGGGPAPSAEAVAADLESFTAGTAPGGADEPLTLSADEAKYKSLEQMSEDIKKLDEVFELLASVPWLDENQLQQKELKGVTMVSLLGTLEEVGFKIRAQVERIWAGEHDDAMILECTEAKDQAALISILFHTKRIEEQYGKARPMAM